MNEQYLQELVKNVSSVTDRGTTIPLQFTGLQKSGGYTYAFEMKNPLNGALYFLKFTDSTDNGTGEIRALGKVTQLFKNEIITEPDPAKRLGYSPVPAILTDDPDKFNPEFSKLFDRDSYALQLQTAARGVQAERKLPDSMADRVGILLALAKLLRLCAKNKVAYVDIKPLEHIFWEKNNDSIYISLIDWGISRSSADISLLAGDIRKFCQNIPEILYGKKMADLQFKGKLSYPIQNETRRALIPLLGQFTFSSELPPLHSEYAILIGDLLSGNMNEFRSQNRCIDIWDAIIDALNDTVRALLLDTGADAASAEDMARQADAFLLSNNGQPCRDFFNAMNARKMALSSHLAWAVTAVRFTQAWYGRIDLIPHTDFDDIIRALIDKDYAGALQGFDKLSAMISQKIAQAESYPELRNHIGVFLTTIRNVIEAQGIISRLNSHKLTPEDFVSEMGISPLRVIDPMLSELYARYKKGPSEPISRNLKSTEKEPISAEISKSSDPLAESAINTARGFKQEFVRTTNPIMLLKSGFFQRLNEFCLNQNAFDNNEVKEQISRLFNAILGKVDIWTQNIRPEKYFVSDDLINGIDWIQSISPVVFTCRFNYEDQDAEFGTVLKSKLSEIFQALYYAIAKEQTAGEPPEILAKISQIKTLRKRLDMDNLGYIRALIDRGELESANQIINLHYSESPYAFDQLNNEISGKRKEQADVKTLTIINSVLNDLSSGDTTLETVRYLNSQKSMAMISDRFFAFKNRSTQLFDLQADLGNTKNTMSDIRKEQKSVLTLSKISLITGIAAAVLSLLLLVVSLAKNASLEQSISSLSKSFENYQKTAEARGWEQKAAEAVISAPTVEPTAVPTEIPLPETIPFQDPNTEEELFIINESEPTPTPEPAVPEADRHLESLKGKAVTFDLSGNVILYNSEDLKEQFANIMNYTQGLTGTLVDYTDKAIYIESEYNIGRTQISQNNNVDVSAQTYVRQYSSVASETTPLFILQKQTKLVKPAADCTTAAQSFCHGTIGTWFDRSVIETNLR